MRTLIQSHSHTVTQPHGHEANGANARSDYAHLLRSSPRCGPIRLVQRRLTSPCCEAVRAGCPAQNAPPQVLMIRQRLPNIPAGGQPGDTPLWPLCCCRARSTPSRAPTAAPIPPRAAAAA
eukprot:scaffold4120_cov57-Phaeocystis_antarctica.AAC.1